MTLTELPGGPIDHHWTKSLDGQSRTARCFMSASAPTATSLRTASRWRRKNRAAIWEVDRASGRWRIFASGLRNPNGLTFEPESGALWTVVNERDELGPNLVPDYMTSVKDGGFYGWPYSYYGWKHLDPRVEPQRPDLAEKAIVPDYALSSHVAPLGLVFYSGDSLPLPEIIAAAHLSANTEVGNRPVFNGYSGRVRTLFSGGRPNGKAQDVVTDFLDADGKARGRPVGLAVDKTGALLIADDVGNTVWRVSPAGR